MNKKDKIMITKISKYVRKLSQAYDAIKNIPENNLEDELYSYSIAQLVTNLKAVYDAIENEEMQERYKLLRQPSIVRIRNIAVHDYSALNWSIVKNGCKKIIENYTNKYNEESLLLLEKQSASQLELDLLDRLKN